MTRTKSIRLLLCIAGWIFLFNPVLFAQSGEGTFKRIALPNDYALSYVKAILTDSKGYLWFGSENGLFRYDGYSVHPFFHDEKNIHSVSSNNINVIFEDSEHNIWVGTDNGLNCYYYRTNNFRNFLHDDHDANTISSNQVWSITQDRSGSLWIGTNGGGLNRAKKNPADSVADEYWFEHISSDPSDSLSLLTGDVWSIYFDNANNGWFGTSHGIFFAAASSISNGNISFKVFRHNENSISPAQDDIWKIYPDEHHHLWFLSVRNEMLDEIDLPDLQTVSVPVFHHYFNNIKPLLTPPLILFDILIDRGDAMWLASASGILVFSVSDLHESSIQAPPQVKWFKNNDADKQALSGRGINALYKDANENIWVGTDAGIAQFNLFSQQFSSLQLQSKRKNYSDHAALEINVDASGKIWIGMDSITLLIYNNGTVMATNLVAPHEQPSVNKSVTCILFSKSGRVYIGTDGGLYWTDPPAGDFFESNASHYTFHRLPEAKSDVNFPPSSNIFSLAEDNLGNIWAGTAKGLYRYVPVEGKIKKVFPSDVALFSPLAYDQSLIFDHAGILWIGTGGGLVKLNPQDFSFEIFKNIPGNAATLSGNQVNCIYESRDHTFWVGTVSGLDQFDATKNGFIHYSTADGLTDNNVSSILEDDSGNLWIATKNGLSQFDLRKKTFRNFNTNDGLISQTFGAASAAKQKNGQLLFGTDGGIVVFNPKDIKVASFNSPVYITDFKLFNHSVFDLADNKLRDEFSVAGKLMLKYDQNFFSFNFTAVDFTNTDRIQYQYMLKGVDEDWVNNSALRFANYTKVAPGEYSFLVRAGNDDIGWKEAKPLQVIITPPWWKTLWFRLLVAVAVVSAVIIFFRMRVNAIRKAEQHKTEIAKQMSELEMTALRAQMNPHFIFNCMNSIQNFILKNDSRAAVKYLNQFATLIRMILDHSKNKTVALSDELKMLEPYIQLEQMRMDFKFDYKILVADDIMADEIEIPTMLLQPFIENAVWHGLRTKQGKGFLQLKIERENHSLKISVEDNGIGRGQANELKAQQKHTHESKGMAITEERIKMLNELYGTSNSVQMIDLKDENGSATGTRVQLIIPLQEHEL